MRFISGWAPRDSCNIKNPSKMYLKLKSREVSFTHILFCTCSPVCNFAQSTTVCTLSKTIGQPKWILCGNEFSRHRSLSLQRASDAYPLLHGTVFILRRRPVYSCAYSWMWLCGVASLTGIGYATLLKQILLQPMFLINSVVSKVTYHYVI